MAACLFTTKSTAWTLPQAQVLLAWLEACWISLWNKTALSANASWISCNASLAWPTWSFNSYLIRLQAPKALYLSTLKFKGKGIFVSWDRFALRVLSKSSSSKLDSLSNIFHDISSSLTWVRNACTLVRNPEIRLNNWSALKPEQAIGALSPLISTVPCPFWVIFGTPLFLAL